MKNQREIYKALLAGESLLDMDNNLAKLNGIGELVNRVDRAIPCDFLFPNNWRIYKEPKWYENIPDGGVLCWVSNDLDAELFVEFSVGWVIGRAENSDYINYLLKSGAWCGSAKPLTKQEIQVFMDNALEAE